MFYITKDKEPEELKIFRQNILTSKKHYDWDDCPPQVKKEIKFSLAIEQNCLCAYCTRKIDEHCNIEHFHEQKNYHNEIFLYNNMLGVDNKKSIPAQFKKKCEDGRGSQILTINPLDKTMINGIYYLSDGTIKHDLYQNDLDNVLNLNHQIFKQNRVGCLKAFKTLNIKEEDYLSYIDLYRKQPYGGIIVYYLEKLKSDPNFKL